MIRLAKIGLIIALFGQLSYLAANFYLNIPHPSYPAWGAMYAGVMVLFFSGRGTRVLSDIDIWFAICMAWLTFSFLIAGESSGADFFTYMVLFMAPAYVCGRYLGDRLVPKDLLLIYGLGVLMLALLMLEYLRDPGAFENVDRLRVFKGPEGATGLQGGTAYYVASQFGGVFMIAVGILSLSKADKAALKLGSMTIHKVAALVSLTVLLLWGSRGSLVAIIVMGGVFLARNFRIGLVRIFLILTTVGVIAVGSYMALPPDRQEFIDQIPAGLQTFGQSSACITEGTSVLAHLTMLREAGKVLGRYPIFGIGSSNFGIYWCGDRMEFMSPHSSLLHALVETGLAGIIPWLMMYGSLLRQYRRCAPRMSPEDRALARCIFLLWAFTFLAGQTAGNIWSDYQIYLLTGMLVPFLVKYQATKTSGIKLSGNAVAVPG
jgi:O-antigen ligase